MTKDSYLKYTETVKSQQANKQPSFKKMGQRASHLTKKDILVANEHMEGKKKKTAPHHVTGK